MNQIIFDQLTSSPLSTYLAALGLFRIVCQNIDSSARCYWQNREFTLVTFLNREQILEYLRDHWSPSPIVSPWNANSGFWGKSGTNAVESMRDSTAARLQIYRDTIATVVSIIDQLRLKETPDKEEKQLFLQALRNRFPLEALPWLDAARAISVMGLSTTPLLGTGGNDGQFEFAITYIKQINNLMDFQTGKATPKSEFLLKAILTEKPVVGLEFQEKIGQFNPLAAGGVNAGAEYSAKTRANAWEYVLALEGALVFTSAATRRLEQVRGVMSYPFAFKPAAVGYCSSEKDQSRGEIWVPEWDQPTSWLELQSVFREGRLKVGSRTAKDGLDAARAISQFGENRGITAFTRYSFQERNGKAHFAIPLDRFCPKDNPQVDLISQIDPWLEQAKSVFSSQETPKSLKSVWHRVELAIYRLAGKQGTLLEVLITLGELEAAQNQSLKFTLEAQERKGFKPFYLDEKSSKKWYNECDNNCPEYRLASCLAADHDFRHRLVYIRALNGNLLWNHQEKSLKTTWQKGSLEQNLLRLLQRQEWEQMKGDKEGKASQQPRQITALMPDLELYIRGSLDGAKLEAMARGLSLLNLSEIQMKTPQNDHAIKLPASYILLALVHRRYLDKNQELMKRVPGLLTQLAAGNSYEATAMASQRLFVSGFNPAIRQGIFEPEDRTIRIGAALAFPISDHDAQKLFTQIKLQKEEEFNHV